jgi:hypothetical protein
MIKTNPLAAAWLFIILSVGAALIFDAHQYPLLVKEGGIIESLSALGYFVCVAAMFYRGGADFAKRYHYLIMLVTLFGMRELDFDKRFTTMGILKSRFYTGDLVPLGEKLIGVVVILVLLYVVIRIIKAHTSTFVTGVKNRVSWHLGTLSVIGALVFSKSIDGLGRKLGDVGITVDPLVATYFSTIEEVVELGIPVLIFVTFTLYVSDSEAKASLNGPHTNSTEA